MAVFYLEFVPDGLAMLVNCLRGYGELVGYLPKR